MNKIIAFLFYPCFLFLYNLSQNKTALDEDIHNWCRWREIKESKFAACIFFVSDRAFRNLFYYRSGPCSRIVSWLFPGYDHLQITTPVTALGGGLIIQHGFATIISAQKIGKNCKIYQQVTIGYNHRLEAPVLGDNVEVCCGAKVIGGVHIGDNVLIGANAVVITDIPSNCVVAGVPAKIIGELTAGTDIFSHAASIARNK